VVLMRVSKGHTLSIAAVVAAGALAWTASHAAGPYDTIYKTNGKAQLHAGPGDTTAVKEIIAKGTKGIILRWCRPEMPFRTWEFGGPKARRGILDKRWCEIDVGGRIGFMHGSHLNPRR
jgi:hypothetical protein